jgi:hypothetical protein
MHKVAWRPLKGHMLSEHSQPEPWAVNQGPIRPAGWRTGLWGMGELGTTVCIDGGHVIHYAFIKAEYFTRMVYKVLVCM